MELEKEERFVFKYQGRKLEVKAKTCRGFWKKFTGKMFTSDERPIIFEFKKQILVKIHMLFVFMPLLVVWFNDQKKVTKIKILKPFGSLEDSEARYVLEIPLKNKLVSDFAHIED